MGKPGTKKIKRPKIGQPKVGKLGAVQPRAVIPVIRGITETTRDTAGWLKVIVTYTKISTKTLAI